LEKKTSVVALPPLKAVPSLDLRKGSKKGAAGVHLDQSINPQPPKQAGQLKEQVKPLVVIPPDLEQHLKSQLEAEDTDKIGFLHRSKAKRILEELGQQIHLSPNQLMRIMSGKYIRLINVSLHFTHSFRNRS
jgi:hypothetical protein